MAGYQSGSIFKESVARREQQRNIDAQFEMQARRQDFAQLEAKRRENFVRVSNVAQYMMTTLDNATPAMFEHTYKQLEGMRGYLRKNAPEYSKALESAYSEKFGELKVRKWTHENPRPQKSLELMQANAEDKPYEHAAFYVREKLWEASRSAFATGTSPPSLVGYHDISPSFGVMIKDNSGTFEVVNRAEMNQDPENRRIAEKYGTTVDYLIKNNWEAPPELHMAEIGMQEVAMRMYRNVKTGQIRIEQENLGLTGSAIAHLDANQRADAARRLERQPMPESFTLETMLSMERGEVIGKDAKTQALYEEIQERLDGFKGSKAEMDMIVNDVLGGKDPNFTYILDPTEGWTKGGFLWRDNKLAKGVKIRAIPGREILFKTKDDRIVRAVYDVKTGIVYNERGQPEAGSLEQIQVMYESNTAERLGLVEPVKVEAQKSTPEYSFDKPVPSHELLKRFRQGDVKDMSTELMNIDGVNKPVLMMRTADGTSKPQTLTPAQYEVFRNIDKKDIKSFLDLYKIFDEEAEVERRSELTSMKGFEDPTENPAATKDLRKGISELVGE